MSLIPKPLVLIILDGWGYRQDTQYNAIAAARKPVWDMLWKQYPHTLIHASEAAVGLPSSQMGNSEVGHLNLGAGRVVYQEYTRINRAISTGTFFTNKTLTDTIDLALKTGSAVHVMGLLSPGGVHSHQAHLAAQFILQSHGKRIRRNGTGGVTGMHPGLFDMLHDAAYEHVLAIANSVDVDFLGVVQKAVQ